MFNFYLVRPHTASCPDANFFSFSDGFLCCTSMYSNVDATITLTNEVMGSEHCKPEYTLACPGMPTSLCQQTTWTRIESKYENIAISKSVHKRLLKKILIP